MHTDKAIELEQHAAKLEAAMKAMAQFEHKDNESQKHPGHERVGAQLRLGPAGAGNSGEGEWVLVSTMSMHVCTCV